MVLQRPWEQAGEGRLKDQSRGAHVGGRGLEASSKKPLTLYSCSLPPGHNTIFFSLSEFSCLTILCSLRCWNGSAFPHPTLAPSRRGKGDPSRGALQGSVGQLEPEFAGPPEVSAGEYTPHTLPFPAQESMGLAKLPSTRLLWPSSAIPLMGPHRPLPGWARVSSMTPVASASKGR